MVNRKNILRASAALIAGACCLSVHPASAQAADPPTCHLGSGIKHVVEIQFDDVHFRRDNPNVPSDLEQIPSLLNFLEGNGTLLANHHTPLISHTSVDILTTLTGVYGAKMEIATAGVESTDAKYAKSTGSIHDLTVARDAIAGEMIAMLEGAAFSNHPVDAEEAERLIDAAEKLLDRAR
jgi:hypothetical protein